MFFRLFDMVNWKITRRLRPCGAAAGAGDETGFL
jgi:hypothetical protein